MKKLLVGAFLGMFTLAGVAVLPNYVNAKDGTVAPAEGESERDNPWGKDYITGKDQKWSQLLTTLKTTINWLLWILATIALAICIWAWFIMVTSGGDEKKYSKWLTILKYAAIWLVIVWLSWLIVSVIFWFIKLQSNWGDIQTTWNQ